MEKILKSGKYFVGNFLGLLISQNIDPQIIEEQNSFFCEEKFQEQFLKFNDSENRNVAFMNCTFGQEPVYVKDNNGLYYDNTDGVFGIIPEEVVTINSKLTIIGFGYIFDFKSEFKVTVNNGKMCFGNFSVDTNF